MALGAAWCGFRFGVVPVREASSLAVAAAALFAFAVSVIRKGAGVRGAVTEHDRRSARVAVMTGIDRAVADDVPAPADRGPEFPPWLDLIAPIVADPRPARRGARRRRPPAGGDPAHVRRCRRSSAR